VYLRSQPARRSSCTNQAVIADMRNARYGKGRLLIVTAFALSASVFINGCQSSATPAVTAPGQIATDDAALAARVKQALVADAGLRSLPISVATYRGVVQLSGYVDSEVQIQKALAVTRGVPGVQSLSNDLHLRTQ
jgi:hyperosmotically inducible protein